MSPELKNHSTPYGSGRTTSGPVSATQMARDCLRERLYGNSKQGFIDIKPYPSQIIQVGSKKRYKTHKNPLQKGLWPGVIQAQKEAEKERGRRRHKRRRRPSDLTLPPSNAIFHGPSGKDPGVPWCPSVPTLRRVGSSGHISRSRPERSSSRRGSLHQIEDEPSIADMRQKRAAIRLGELERVIPPSKSALEELRAAAARPHPLTWATLSGPIDTFYPNPADISPPNTSSPLSPQHKHKPTPPSSYSSTNRLAVPRPSGLPNPANSADPAEGGHRRSALSSLAFSADLLDSTRRTITSAIRRSAEKTVHSFSHRGNGSANYPSDDDESFYCVGKPLPRAFHHTETVPSPVSSLTSSIHSSELSPDSSKVGSGRHPENKGVWMDAETECRLCKRKCPVRPRGLCSNCEEEFKRPVTRYVDFPFDDEIKPILPLRIVKVAAKNHGFDNNTNLLPRPNSSAKTTKPVSIFAQDPGPPPTIPLPKIPTKEANIRTAGENSPEVRIRSAEHHARVEESPGYASQEGVVHSVLQAAMSLRTKNRVVKRKKLASTQTGQNDERHPTDLRVAYNNTAETAPSDEVTLEEKPREAVPTKGSGEDSGGRERRESLTRGSENRNRRRPNSREEGGNHEGGLVRRDTSFYSFYDEILEDAKKRPARRRDDGRG